MRAAVVHRIDVVAVVKKRQRVFLDLDDQTSPALYMSASSATCTYCGLFDDLSEYYPFPSPPLHDIMLRPL